MARTLDHPVPQLKDGLGVFHRGVRALAGDPRGQVPVFYQVLDGAAFSLAFESGSAAYQVLTNDQNRFSPPRSLPPILDLEAPGEEDHEFESFVITRYAYSEGAFRLLEDLLTGGHVFGMNDFLELGWSLAQVLAFLHEHKIVHGQWNARSVTAIPTENRLHPLRENPSYRFEVFNTGVCFQDPAAIPAEYLSRDYYPPEAFLSAKGVPDYGALDLRGDVYCFAAFLRDLMHRSCSSEELPSQATRILEELQKEANRRGWKAAPEALRQKELEILDHLYTIRARTESMIQDGLRPRDERCTARHFLELTSDLHEKATTYLDRLFERGFEPVNVFGDDLLHYTTFTIGVRPERINSYEDSEIVLEGSGLPEELVRITLNESHERIHVASAQRNRIEFKVESGLASGRYKISINNRRTNCTLDVVSPVWESVEPSSAHLPWEGFGNIVLTVCGRQLPRGVRYSLWPAGDEGSLPTERLEVVSVRAIGGEEDGGRPGDEVTAGEGEDETVALELPVDVEPGRYELAANFLPTGLEVRVAERLADPVISAGALEREEIKNHRDWELRVTGRNFHPDMVIDFGEASPDGVVASVENAGEALLTVPAGFAPGDYRLRLNYRDTGVRLCVRQPSWGDVRPASVVLRRQQEDPFEVIVSGDGLPGITDTANYALLGRKGQPIAGAVLDVEEVTSEAEHRLRLSPDLARSRPAISFGGVDTGLRLRVRRQLPRTAWAAAAVVALLAVIGVVLLLENQLAPRITSVEPPIVFNFGPQAVEVEGAHLAAVQLVDDDGAAVATVPVEAIEDRDGAYRFAASGIAVGQYRLRPVGAIFGARDTELSLTVRSPHLRVEPGTLHRFEDAAVRVTSGTGFDPSVLQKLQLFKVGDPVPFADLELNGGRATVTAGQFLRGQEGDYEVALDGVRLLGPTDAAGERMPATLQIVGPRIADVQPNPASLDQDGNVNLEIMGSHLGDALWVGLSTTDEQGTPVVHTLSPFAIAGQYRGPVTPGRYGVLFGMSAEAAELLPEVEVRVFPTPNISQVTPQKLSPDRATSVSFEGLNLAGLDKIVLRPLDGSAASVEIPLDREKLRQLDELQGTYAHDLALASGSYVVEPADAGLQIDVFDDCRALVEAFESDADAEQMLRCLASQKPPQDVIRRAADLLFDRGLFVEARELYARSDRDLVADFRISLVDAYLQKQSIPLMKVEPDEATAPYAVAAIRLGWAGGEMPEFPADVALPWELEFVRGVTTQDAEAAVAALQQTAAKKTAACGGYEIADFPPVLEALAGAQLRLVVDLIGSARHQRAREVLQTALIESPDTWDKLDGSDRADALFWYGHLQLWYGGDIDAAIASFERANALGSGDASELALDYLEALGSGSTSGDAGVRGTGWQAAFVRVFQYYKEVRHNPNYSLLTERHGGAVYLPAAERKRSRELQSALKELEGLEAADPFAHFALLYYMRNAQRVAWPNQDGGAIAPSHRQKLESLALSEDLEAVREYYLLLADVEPFDVPQIAVFTRSEKREKLERILNLQKMVLPASFQGAAEDLKKKFSTPSVIWSLR